MGTMNPIEQFTEKLAASLQEGTFVRLILSRPVPAADAPGKALARLVDVKGQPRVSVTYRHATRDVTKNLSFDEAPGWIREQVPARFANALLGTTKRDWQLHVDASGEAKLVGHKPAVVVVPSRRHDRTRPSILDDSARDWLQGLDVLDARGHVRPSMADKHSQIHRFLEIFTHLAKECGWTPTERELVLGDMGCGKGYLTFGVWHLFHRVWKQPARVLGVETRRELVKATRALAGTIGAAGLEFQEGTIDSAKLPKLDALIALHACDTATDDAIRRGIELGAQLIVVAPCCHREARPQLGTPGPIASALTHGILAERLAEWATDGLRAMFLEWAGYRARVFEFVSSEHTPKNLMIAAIRRDTPFVSQTARETIVEFKSFFGIQHHALDPLLAGSK